MIVPDSNFVLWDSNSEVLVLNSCELTFGGEAEILVHPFPFPSVTIADDALPTLVVDADPTERGLKSFCMIPPLEASELDSSSELDELSTAENPVDWATGFFRRESRKNSSDASSE